MLAYGLYWIALSVCFGLTVLFFVLLVCYLSLSCHLIVKAAA